MRYNRELEHASNRSLDVSDELRPIWDYVQDLTFVTSDVVPYRDPRQMVS
jgi:hypothetical protein